MNTETTKTKTAQAENIGLQIERVFQRLVKENPGIPDISVTYCRNNWGDDSFYFSVTIDGECKTGYDFDKILGKIEAPEYRRQKEIAELSERAGRLGMKVVEARA